MHRRRHRTEPNHSPEHHHDPTRETSHVRNTVTNHRPQRKQLSDQLDRLDALIDGLADHLPQAVADATRDGVRQAVRDVLAELLTDPEVVARLRAALPPGPAAGVTDREQKPGAFARLKSAVRAGVTRTTEIVKSVANRGRSGRSPPPGSESGPSCPG